MNYGLIESQPTNPRDYILGSTSKLPTIVLQADRNYLAYKPTKENQRNNIFDTYCCVTFSRNNCLEILEKRKYGTQYNRSDRFLGVISGTIPGQGNYVDRVAQTGHALGSVKEERYPFTATMTESEFYKKIPDEIVNEALTYKEVYKDTYEWVSWGGADKNKIFEAMQYAPIQITIQAYGALVGGIFQPTGHEETNHVVTLIRWDALTEPMYILDHYDNEIKKLHPDYYIGSAMRHNIEKNMLKLIKGDQEPKVYVVGEDGKLRHIYNEAVFAEGHAAGFWGNWDLIELAPQVAIDEMEKGHDIAFII